MVQKLTEVIEKNQKVVFSGKKEFNWEDLKAFGENALKYSSPVIVMILIALQAGQSWDEIKLAVYAVLLQNAINFFSKWSGEARYIVDKK